MTGVTDLCAWIVGSSTRGCWAKCNYIWSYNDVGVGREKRRATIRKHGFDFADAIEMFSGAMLVYPDTRHDYEETRWSGLRWIGGSLTQIFFIEKEADIIRIISLRKATIRERKEFEKTIDDGLEAH